MSRWDYLLRYRNKDLRTTGWEQGDFVFVTYFSHSLQRAAQYTGWIQAVNEHTLVLNRFEQDNNLELSRRQLVWVYPAMLNPNRRMRDRGSSPRQISEWNNGFRTSRWHYVAGEYEHCDCMSPYVVGGFDIHHSDDVRVRFRTILDREYQRGGRCAWAPRSLLRASGRPGATWARTYAGATAQPIIDFMVERGEG